MRIPARRAAAWLLSTGAAVAAISAPNLHASIAPPAHADRVANVNDLCNGYKPGYVRLGDPGLGCTTAAFAVDEVVETVNRKDFP